MPIVVSINRPILGVRFTSDICFCAPWRKFFSARHDRLVMVETKLALGRKIEGNCITNTLIGLAHLISEPVNTPALKRNPISVPAIDIDLREGYELDRTASSTSTDVGDDVIASPNYLYSISFLLQQAVHAACSCTVPTCCRS